MLSKNSVTPLHVQLAGLLRDQMQRKELELNSRLPSERELCDRYGISRITVRQALATLAQEGLVNSAVGKGTFVAAPRLNEELKPLSSFTQDLERRGMSATSKLLEGTVFPADDQWAGRLGLPRGAEVVRLHRLRLADGSPIAIQITHLPHHLCPHLLTFDFSTRSLYDVLRLEYQLKLVRSETFIEAALAQAEEAALLQIKRPAAVLISEQTTYLESHTAIEITRSVFHSERYQLHTNAF